MNFKINNENELSSQIIKGILLFLLFNVVERIFKSLFYLT